MKSTPYTFLAKLCIKILSFIQDQLFWEMVYRFALRKMNYGNGGDFTQSGELNALKFIKKKLGNQPNLVVFDVGANHGHYSNALATHFGALTKIYAFEPSKKTFDILRQTTQKHQNIILNNLGMGDKPSTINLYSNADGSGLASVYQRNLEHYSIQMNTREEISITTVSAFCLEHNIPHIHFLKLDIEGHELKALEGAKSMIEAQKIDFIQFEFGGCNIDSRSYFQDFFYLLHSHYSLYRIVEHGLYEILHYNEFCEIFITINFLAIRRGL